MMKPGSDRPQKELTIDIAFLVFVYTRTKFIIITVLLLLLLFTLGRIDHEG